MIGDTLVVAPHPDDETLGAGGTLMRCKAAGAKIHWVLLTTAEGAGYPDDYVATQARQVEAVRDGFGFDGFHWLKIPASDLHRADHAALIGRLRMILKDARPDTVLIPHAHDAHDDHRVAHALAAAACKSFLFGSLGVRRLAAMDILSETDAAPPTQDRAFLPTVGIDISAHLEDKIRLFTLYASEVHETGGPRSLAALRAKSVADGAAFGFPAAERFMLLREAVA